MLCLGGKRCFSNLMCDMGKKRFVEKVKKVRVTFEVEERHTGCCECLFGGTCPYACAFSGKLDCAKYNLGSMKLVEIKDVEE